MTINDEFAPVPGTEPAPSLGPADLPAWPQYDDGERTALLRALEQGQWWRAGGTEVTSFEREFADYNGAPHALAVNSGTDALELALRVHGIGPGDEVIVPAFTFVSTSLAVQNTGAVPVPADVDPGHQCLTGESVRAVATERTRVIMPVHMAGHVADLAALHKVADEFGAVVVQDAAHAQGAARDGVLVGADASIACYSFQNGKLMTAGEGGALTFPDRESYDRAYLLHTVGRPREDTTYQHLTGGMNARMNEFSGAVLRTQLTRLAGQTVTRGERAALLDELLAPVEGVAPQERDPRVTVNPYYMYLLTLDAERFDTAARDRLVGLLKQRNVPACVNFPPVYRTAGFWTGPTEQATVEELAERCPEAELIGSRGLWLHHRILLAEPGVVRGVAAVIAAAVDEAGR
ncbi:DegT/DnrJ/EryC1/StrS family aminotransferase [Streptomyces sp. NPDC051018]|uniref:DegT/DnrJ/EryC1/StrS family aminotransferase n=1 Tax=Streptomyces sp. NPDC051018 TaxID=3365639 RepID=UPI0037A5AD63